MDLAGFGSWKEYRQADNLTVAGDYPAARVTISGKFLPLSRKFSMLWVPNNSTPFLPPKAVIFLKGVALPRFYVVAADVIPVSGSIPIERTTRFVVASGSSFVW